MTSWIRRHPVLVGLAAVSALVAGVWVVKLAAVARSVGTHAEHWSEPRGEPGGLLYVALGDSAAQGIGASSPEKGYVGLLAERLRTSSGQPVLVVNLSSSGARLDDVLDTQVPALQELEPDLVTVAVGGNDIVAFDAAAFGDQADRLGAALPPGTYLADAPYFMHGRWEDDARTASDLLQAAAAEHGLRPVDLHDAGRAQGWQAMVTQFAADWFHPNDRGHRVWADAFWSEITADGVPGTG